MPERIRTFIAVELSDEARRHIAERRRELEPAASGVRWVAPENVHLTLVFVGDVPAAETGAVADAVREAVAGAKPFTVTLGGTGRFPPKGKPRVVWVGVEDAAGALAALQNRVAEATAGFAEKEETRPYHPHLTLGRVKGGGNLWPLSEAIERGADAGGPTLEVREVVVFRSDLRSGGAVYTPLARLALGGEGPEPD
jgi:2'-5' RNA ligase